CRRSDAGQLEPVEGRHRRGDQSEACELNAGVADRAPLAHVIDLAADRPPERQHDQQEQTRRPHVHRPEEPVGHNARHLRLDARTREQAVMQRKHAEQQDIARCRRHVEGQSGPGVPRHEIKIDARGKGSREERAARPHKHPLEPRCYHSADHGDGIMSLWKAVELALTGSARLAWPVFQAVNRRFEGRPFQPRWSDAPLMKSHERSSPQLGWPRTTDSLCPSCVRETRARILSGEQSIESLINQHVGEIPASIFERDGKVVVEKTCPLHGTFTDTLAINPDFLRRIESLFPGRDFDAVTDRLHNHGTSSIKHGRGAVLTIDLTNRCNMMCDPCFMDANQVGYVHELTLDEVKQLLDDAVSIKPRRQMTVQFSGGEPTISPLFLDAVRYAKQVGYFSVQAATNGIRFAQEPEFAHQAREA